MRALQQSSFVYLQFDKTCILIPHNCNITNGWCFAKNETYRDLSRSQLADQSDWLLSALFIVSVLRRKEADVILQTTALCFV